jgi:hypothetical protein
VEEGDAFCPNCHAPQIRVAGTPSNEPATPPLTPGTPGEVQPPARPVDLHRNEPAAYGVRPGFGAPPAPTHISWSDALPGAALAGVLIALSFIPLLSLLLWPTVAGILAVMLYMRRHPEQHLTGKLGARIGSMAGVFGFILAAVLMVVELAALRGGGQLRETVMQAIQQSAARNPSPEAQAMVQRLLSPEGIAVMIGVALLFSLAIFAGFGALGGALGARLTERHRK